MGIKSNGGSSSYYLLPEGARDVLDLIDYKNMGFGVGNIFKACFRLGEKAGVDKVYDLNKIIFFAQRELEKETSSVTSAGAERHDYRRREVAAGAAAAESHRQGFTQPQAVQAPSD